MKKEIMINRHRLGCLISDKTQFPTKVQGYVHSEHHEKIIPIFICLA